MEQEVTEELIKIDDETLQSITTIKRIIKKADLQKQKDAADFALSKFNETQA